MKKITIDVIQKTITWGKLKKKKLKGLIPKKIKNYKK
jgi:hypothetical protein